MTEHRPYGSWPSPIPAELLVAGASSPTAVAASAGVTWWSERRPSEGGREQLVRRDADGTLHDVLPDGWNARTRVHEYGGGAWWTGGDAVFFVNWSDQRVWRLPADATAGRAPQPVSAEPPAPHAWRYADGVRTPDGRFVVVVREDHSGVATGGEVRNEIVALPADGGGANGAEAWVLAGGSDFVAAPRVSPDGTRLAWIAWDHPDMPWDDTRLLVAQLSVGEDGRLRAGEAVVHAGGVAGTEESLVQPEWGDDGTLYVVSDRTRWWNVHRVAAPGELVAVAPVEAEVGEPAWVFGQSRYVVAPGGTVWFTYSADDGAHLAEVTSDGRAFDHPVACLRLSSLRFDARPDGDRLVALTAEADREPSVIELSIGPGGEADPAPAGACALEPAVLRAPRDLGLPDGSLSRGRRIAFPSAGGRTAYAWFYPPAGAGVNGPHGELPPLLVQVHGGPTGAANPSFTLATQFWTTRGFAVVDVDYGGSTGYGRDYRRLLDGAWGVVDVEDVCAAARHLAAEGLVDGARLAIRGGSAGGFTVLAALARTDVFAAGASHYGVADLGALARDTHKFESRYLDRLVGRWPQDEAVYLERSPLSHLDGFTAPLIVLQGLEDEVVPPSQAELIVDGLAARGVPYAYLTFEGEQHGFRQAASIVRAITAELSFYAQVFGFELADDVEPVALVGGVPR